MDEDLERVKQVFAPDMIQLHGHETLERVKAIQARGFSVIKALAIGSADDVAAADVYATVSDALLLDAKPPKGSDLPGGNGVQMDWSLLAGVRFDVPWFLSGGLDPDNVADALRLTAAPGVDVSSGVEKAPGLKDPDRVAAFLKAVATVS
jgi:phosphoribosylanthranilate isomerase